MPLKPGKIHQGDCLKLMGQIETGSVDLAFADPPFNIGYKYDKYHDSQEDAKYLRACYRISCTFPREREDCCTDNQTEILREIRDAIGGARASAA